MRKVGNSMNKFIHSRHDNRLKIKIKIKKKEKKKKKKRVACFKLFSRTIFFLKKKDGKNGTNKVKVGTRIVKPKSKDNQRANEH